MNNCYTFKVLHLKTEQTRGLAPIIIKANPVRLAIIETKYRVSLLLLEQIWQSLLHQQAMPYKDDLELSVITLNGYEWQCQRTENEMILSVQKISGQPFQQPVIEFCNLIDTVVIDPSHFLRLSEDEQYSEVNKVCATYPNHKLIKTFDLAIQNNKIFLQNKPIVLAKASHLDLIKLAITVSSLKKPHLHVIKINNWLLLNPAHVKPLEQIATKLDCLLWFTMGVCSRK